MKTKEEHAAERNFKPDSNNTLAEILLDIRDLIQELVKEKTK